MYTLTDWPLRSGLTSDTRMREVCVLQTAFVSSATALLPIHISKTRAISELTKLTPIMKF